MVARLRIWGDATFLAAWETAGTFSRISGFFARWDKTAIEPIWIPSSCSSTRRSSSIPAKSTKALGLMTAVFNWGSTSEPPAMITLPSSSSSRHASSIAAGR